MPRPRGVKKTTEEKITEKEQLISELTEKLEREKEELKVLYDKQIERRTSQILSIMNDNNLSIEDIERIISEYISNKVSEEIPMEIAI